MSGPQIRRFLITSVFAVGISFIPAILKAQDIESGVSRQTLRRVQSSGPRRPPPPKTIYVPVPKLIYIKATPTTGTLFVTARPNAHVTVEPVRGGTGKEGI